MSNAERIARDVADLEWIELVRQARIAIARTHTDAPNRVVRRHLRDALEHMCAPAVERAVIARMHRACEDES